MSDGSFDPAVLRPSGALLAAHLALGAAIDREANAATDVDPTMLDLLVRIDLAPGKRLRAVEICRQLKMSPSHISRVIDRAEADGLVARSPDPDDRRASLVSLTPSGRAVVADYAPRLHAVLDRVVFETLDTAEIDTLVDLLTRLEAAADAVTDHP